MRYPKYLPINGTIGFVAPSMGCATEPYFSCFQRTQEVLREKGFQTILGPNCYEAKGIGISNTPVACAREFLDAYGDSDTDVLISCGGGELMCEILEYLDFEQLKAFPPKWFMGYSDNTNLTFLLNTICDVASVYGPNAKAFSYTPWHSSVEDALSVLQGDKHAVKGYPFFESEEKKEDSDEVQTIAKERILKLYLPSGKFVEDARTCKELVQFDGRLIGGCMDCLGNLIGTKFDHVSDYLEKYKEDGFFWFMEACELNPFSVRRTLWQMEQAGWFKYIKGFLFGRPMMFGQEIMGLNHYDAVMGILNKYNVPIIMDADLGHISPMMPIISGSVGHLEVLENEISLSYEMKL